MIEILGELYNGLHVDRSRRVGISSIRPGCVIDSKIDIRRMADDPRRHLGPPPTGDPRSELIQDDHGAPLVMRVSRGLLSSLSGLTREKSM